MGGIKISVSLQFFIKHCKRIQLRVKFCYLFFLLEPGAGEPSYFSAAFLYHRTLRTYKLLTFLLSEYIVADWALGQVLLQLSRATSRAPVLRMCSAISLSSSFQCLRLFLDAASMFFVSFSCLFSVAVFLFLFFLCLTVPSESFQDFLK